MFDLAEDDITDSNYNQVVRHLNETYPEVIQELDLKTCNLNTFLSEVRLQQVCVRVFMHQHSSFEFSGKLTTVYFQIALLQQHACLFGPRELKELV